MFSVSVEWYERWMLLTPPVWDRFVTTIAWFGALWFGGRDVKIQKQIVRAEPDVVLPGVGGVLVFVAGADVIPVGVGALLAHDHDIAGR